MHIYINYLTLITAKIVNNIFHDLIMSWIHYSIHSKVNTLLICLYLKWLNLVIWNTFWIWLYCEYFDHLTISWIHNAFTCIMNIVLIYLYFEYVNTFFTCLNFYYIITRILTTLLICLHLEYLIQGIWSSFAVVIWLYLLKSFSLWHVDICRIWTLRSNCWSKRVKKNELNRNTKIFIKYHRQKKFHWNLKK